VQEPLVGIAHEMGGNLLDHAQSEGLQRRDEVGQLNLAPLLVEANAGQRLALARLVHQPHHERLAARLELLEPLDVECGDVHVG
jgi:hypothetical protein